MSKCVVSKPQQQQRSSSSMAAAVVAGTATGYLTLRSGRRVPAESRCGATSSHCSRRRRIKSVRQRCRVVFSSGPLMGGGRSSEQEQVVPAPEKTSSTVVRIDDCSCGGDSRFDDVDIDPSISCIRPSYRQETLLTGEAAASKKGQHQHGANRPMTLLTPPPEAELEAFFAAAELAERRRFAESYNYDVALDLPLEGRFEWAPVST